MTFTHHVQHPSRWQLNAAAAATLSLLVGTAAAQSEATAPDSAEPAKATATLDTVVITSQKRSTLASKTPVSLAVMTGEDLKTQGAADTKRLAELMPNVQLGNGALGGVEVSMRGIGSTNNTEVGDPAVAVSIDGVTLGRPQMAGAAIYDLQRIEVLRGPQGTLYGRNATAGAINIITNKPGRKLEGAVGLSIGNYHALQADAMVNVPVNSLVSLRAVVSRSQRDGYVDTAHAPANNFAHDRSDTDNTSGRLHALFTFAKDSTLLLSADTSRDGGAGPGAVAYATLAAHRTGDAGRHVANPKYEGRQRNRASGVSAEFNQGLGSVNLTVQAGHRSQTRNLLYSVADAASGAFNHTEFSQNSLEARLASDGSGPLQWVAGAFHFDEKGSPVVLQAFGPQLLFIQDPMKTRSSAAFGQATYTVAPGLRATGGLRYTSDTKSRMGCAYPFAALRTAGLNDLADPDAPLTGAPDQSRLPACPVASINNVPSTQWKQTTYRAGLDYDLDANTLLYASYATGFKAGGFNDGNIATAANINAIIYNPEKLAAFEAGLKGRWLDGRLRLNVSLFSYSYTDLQVTSLTTCSSGTGLCTVTQNAAKASSRGGELEGSFLASDVDRLTFGLGVTNAKYDRFTTSGGADWKGFKLDKSPSTTVNLGYSRQFPLASGAAITAGISARYSAGYELSNSAANLRFAQASFHKTDVNLSYDSPDDRWSLQAYVRNIEDRNVATSYQASGGQHGVYLAEPRMVGVRANLKF